MASEIDEITLQLTEACSFHRGIVNPSFHYYFTDCFLIGVFKRSPDNALSSCRHNHSAYEFIIPLSPITSLIAENSIYIGNPNFIYPVQSGRVHGIKYPQNNVSYIDLIVEKSFFESLIHKMGKEEVEFNTTLPYSESLHNYIRNFRNEFGSNEPQNELILKPLRDLICVEIIRSAISDSFDSRNISEGYAPGISLVVNHINSNYDKEISVSELARICGLSKPYFSSIFKQIFRTTPKAYVNALRIAKAKNMLEFSDLPIKEVASSCGFQNLNTFFYAFKKSTDMTPSEFKASHREETV